MMTTSERLQNLEEAAKSAPAGEEILDAVIEVAELLISKNVAYGNSALNPIRVFAKGLDTQAQLLVRIDDKINRIANGSEFIGDDTVLDLAGYLVLLLANRGQK